MYQTICMDPAWNERGGGKIKRGADRHYPLIKTRDLPDVITGSPLWRPDPARCSVWCWTTVSSLPDALWLIGKLGATYVTHAVWVKGTVTQEIVAPASMARPSTVRPDPPGLGQRLRCGHELLLYSRIGKVPRPPTHRRMPSVFYAPRTRHSEKPRVAYDLIEAHDGSDTRKAELFARTERPGWDVWGSEV